MPSGHPCILTIAGERRSVAEWAIIADVPRNTILARLRRNPGMAHSLAVFGEAEQTKPKRGRPKAKPAPLPLVRSQWGSCLSITWKAA